jgi:hypothetical protein
MRHLILLTALLIPGSASAADPVPPPPPAGILSPGAKNTVTGEPCMPANVVRARPGDSPRANKLGELPPGDLLLAVLREEDGCHVPVIVRHGVGMNAAPAPREPRTPSPLRPQRL